MLTIEPNSEGQTLEISVRCDDCESEIHPISWVDAVHCRRGQSTCSDSDNHDGAGCMRLGECQCLPLNWTDYYVEAIECYYGLHPEFQDYRIIGL
jgi:hypothetical protein